MHRDNCSFKNKRSKNADILVTAIGKPELITKDYIKKNSLIIDVGINRITREGKSKLVGDIKFDDAFSQVKKMTPVPGGVGPMTIACLMHNTLKTAFLLRNQNFGEIGI